MSEDPPTDRDRSGFPVLPVLFALLVAGGALAALFLYDTAPPPTPPRAMAAAQPAPVPPPEDHGIQTMVGLPGYGSYDGAAFTDRAKKMAETENASSLLARVQNLPANARGGANADYAAALALKQERGEGDRGQILAAMENLSQHPDKGVRRNALWALSRRGDDGLDAMGRSLAQLSESDANPGAQQDLIAAMGEIAPEADRAIELLTNRVRYSSSPKVQQSAAETLAKMGPTAQGSLRDVFKDLRTDQLSRSDNDEILKRLNGILTQLDQIEGFER